MVLEVVKPLQLKPAAQRHQVGIASAPPVDHQVCVTYSPEFVLPEKEGGQHEEEDKERDAGGMYAYARA
jgi:hypothetical protein|tara:strand:- start:268 stop:474 length:207 start_codon:yes stop_codon:yes gene_type:complete